MVPIRKISSLWVRKCKILNTFCPRLQLGNVPMVSRLSPLARKLQHPAYHLCWFQEEAVWKALAYYESCLDKDEIEKLKGKPLERLIQQYGSWSITDKSWKEEDWELITNLARIHKYLALPIFFTTTVAIDNKNSSQYIITVCLGAENLFCCLLRRKTGMDIDLSLKDLGQLFPSFNVMPAKTRQESIMVSPPWWNLFDIFINLQERVVYGRKH